MRIMGLHEETPGIKSEATQTLTQIRSDELDTIAEGTTAKHRRHRDVDLETRAYFDNFMAISDEVSKPQYETQESFGLGLDFSCTDIEADGVSASSYHHADDHDSQDETDSASSGGSDPESDITAREDSVRERDSEFKDTQKKFREGGRALREIADRIDREFFESNPNAGAELDDLIDHLTHQAADIAFESTIDKVLEQFNSFPQRDDKYKVALVMLCARRSIIAMNSALNTTKETTERVIGRAMSYIARHYPGWTENFR